MELAMEELDAALAAYTETDGSGSALASAAAAVLGRWDFDRGAPM